MKECGWIEKCFFQENSKQFVEIVDANRKQTLLFWCSMEGVGCAYECGDGLHQFRKDG